MINWWRVSRYWNKVAYFVIDMGRKMIWDYTGKNADILKEDVDYVREIMTNTD